VEGIIFAISFPLISAAVIIHFASLIPEEAQSQFELAIVSATIGGLLMVGGFIDKANKKQARELINIGKWFLIASVFATLYGLFLNWISYIDKIDTFGENLILTATIICLVFATFAFSWAISLLLPNLWKLGRNRH